MKRSKGTKAIYINPAASASRHRLYRIIRGLPAGEYAVDLVRQRKSALSSQRGYYWGYLLPEIGRALGRDREGADKILCALFLSETWPVGEEVVTVVRSTADLSADQTDSFYVRVRAYAWNKWRLDLKQPGGAG